jgi:hypothetical protein
MRLKCRRGLLAMLSALKAGCCLSLRDEFYRQECGLMQVAQGSLLAGEDNVVKVSTRPYGIFRARINYRRGS